VILGMFIGPNPNSNCSLHSLVMDPWCNSSMSFLKDCLVQLTLAVQRFDGWPENFQGINSELAGKSDNLISATSSHQFKKKENVNNNPARERFLPCGFKNL